MENDGSEGEEDPDPLRAFVPLPDGGLARDGAPVEDAVLIVLGRNLAETR